MQCTHCGESCLNHDYKKEDLIFCCNGCLQVYNMLRENNLSTYYNLNDKPGQKITLDINKWAFLDSPEIKQRLTIFSDDVFEKVVFQIPQIHCSSCIWLLERLYKLNPFIKHTEVDFISKEIEVAYIKDKIELSDIAFLLESIGYKPKLNVENNAIKQTSDHSAILKLVVAGVCFGNIMLLSFPEYFGLSESEAGFRSFFNKLSLLLSIPVVFYSAQDYIKTAFQGLKGRNIDINFPIALGIIALFIRSIYDVLVLNQAGYFDSLTGFVFFLLISKYLQTRTFKNLSFNNSLNNFFNLSVCRLNKEERDYVVLDEVQQGDELIYSNQDVISVEGELISETAIFDYSFISGESRAVAKKKGDKIYLGGRVLSDEVHLKVQQIIDDTSISKLWKKLNAQQFKTSKIYLEEEKINRFSRYFIVAILLIAIAVTIAWIFIDSSRAFEIFTSILIVACPCALAIASPIIYSTAAKILSRKGFFVGHSSDLQSFNGVDTIIFDKTGTLTNKEMFDICYEGENLNKDMASKLNAMCQRSTHPLAYAISEFLQKFECTKLEINEFEEVRGKGMKAQFEDDFVLLGSASFLDISDDSEEKLSLVYLKKNDEYFGKFMINNLERENLETLFNDLEQKYILKLLSGDRAGLKSYWSKYFHEENILFEQSPEEKLNEIEKLKESKHRVLMIGDGLNDSLAMKKSDFSIAVIEESGMFNPACNGIILGKNLSHLNSYISFSNALKNLVNLSLFISLLYNIIGLLFAVLGLLKPFVAAILMPLSSLSILIIALLGSQILSHIYLPKK